MFVIPDLSYFAVPGFIDKMADYPTRSCSMILHNTMDDQWDKILTQKDAQLITWLHLETNKTHNIFFPYSPNEDFIRYSARSFKSLIDPAISRIKQYLNLKEIENIDDYMKNSEEWLFLLFDNSQYYFSAEFMAEYLGLQNRSFPMILVWTKLESKDFILISPYSYNYSIINEYTKALYWSITKATQITRENNRGELDIRDLKDNIQDRFNLYGTINNFRTGRNSERIEVIRSQKTIADNLREVGEKYKEYFNNAILNFEEYIEEFSEEKNIIRICNESKNNIVLVLKENGFKKVREGGNHEIYQHPKLKKTTAVPRHNKLSPFVINSIKKDIQMANR